jgi:hypothetical protein
MGHAGGKLPQLPGVRDLRSLGCVRLASESIPKDINFNYMLDMGTGPTTNSCSVPMGSTPDMMTGTTRATAR